MVLYCVDAPVFIGYALLHRYAYQPEQKAVLIADKNMYETRGLLGVLKNFKDNQIFDDVIICNLFLDTHLNCDEKTYTKYCIDFFNEAFTSNGYRPEQFDTIYSINDDWDGMINLYFNLIEKEYIWLAANRDCLMDLPQFSGSRQFLELVEKYQFITPFAPFACAELQADSSIEMLETMRMRKKDYRIWDKKAALEALPEEILATIIRSYGSQDVADDSCLLIVNSYGACFYVGEYTEKVKRILGVRTNLYAEVFSVMNNTALDYYIPENMYVYMKPHPNDPISDEMLQQIYGGCIKNLTTAPYELTQKYLQSQKVKFSYIIGYDSNALEVIGKDLYEKKYVLGKSFMRTWFFYDSLYTVQQLAQYFKRELYAEEDIYEQLLFMGNNAINGISILSEEKQNIHETVIIINCLTLQQSEWNCSDVIEHFGKDNIICFLNNDLSELFFEELHHKYLSPLIIHKTLMDENKLPLYRNETIWIYAANPHMHRRLYDFRIDRFLPRQQLRLSIQKNTPMENEILFQRCWIAHSLYQKGETE